MDYLEIELCLDLGRDVDGVGRRSGRGQGRSGLGKVAESMVGLAFQKLDLEKFGSSWKLASRETEQ